MQEACNKLTRDLGDSRSAAVTLKEELEVLRMQGYGGGLSSTEAEERMRDVLQRLRRAQDSARVCYKRAHVHVVSVFEYA